MTRTTWGSFSAGAMAACGAVTVTNPAEVVKTRYLPPTIKPQIQPPKKH